MTRKNYLLVDIEMWIDVVEEMYATPEGCCSFKGVLPPYVLRPTGRGQRKTLATYAAATARCPGRLFAAPDASSSPPIRRPDGLRAEAICPRR